MPKNVISRVFLAMRSLLSATSNVFSIWYSYFSLPAGLVLFGIWVAAAIIAFIVARMRKSKLGSA